MASMMGIYEIVNLYDGRATAYVGSSVDIERRWRGHARALQLGSHDNAHLQNAWDKYGKAAFGWSVIEVVCANANLLEREQYWLDRYLESPNTCYNIATTAGPGGLVSDETRRKLSKAAKGREPWNKGGGVCSSKTRRKMSKTRKGVPKTEEHKRRISEGVKLQHANAKAAG